MSDNNGGGTWPEQDAIDLWLKKYNIALANKYTMELKKEVTKPRIEVQNQLTKAQEEIEGLRETLTLIGSQPTIEYGSHAALKICVIKARKALDKLKEHNK